jgi:hypothetical protein
MPVGFFSGVFSVKSGSSLKIPVFLNVSRPSVVLRGMAENGTNNFL